MIILAALAALAVSVLLLYLFVSVPYSFYFYSRLVLAIIAGAFAVSLFLRFKGEGGVIWVIFAAVGFLYNPLSRDILTREIRQPLDALTLAIFVAVFIWALRAGQSKPKGE